MINCAKCKYWIGRDFDPDGTGECKRHAPHPEITTSNTIGVTYIFWPLTHMNDECGDGESSYD